MELWMQITASLSVGFVAGSFIRLVLMRDIPRRVRGNHRADHLSPNTPESGAFQYHADKAMDVANSGNEKNRIRRIQS